MKLIVLFALVATVAADDGPAIEEAAKSKEKEEPPRILRIREQVRLAAVKNAQPDKGGYGVVVNLEADGRIFAGDLQCSLQSLGQLLEAESKKYKRAGSASSMRVLLRLHRDAPWLHVQWVRGVCKLSGIYRVDFGVMRPNGKPGHFKCWIKRREDLEKMREEEEKGGGGSASFDVHVKGANPKPVVYVGQQFTKPTTFRFHSDGRPDDKAANLGKKILASKARADKFGVPFGGMIHAGRQIPVGVVLEVLDEYRKCKVAEVDFPEAALPAGRAFESLLLPYPKP